MRGYMGEDHNIDDTPEDFEKLDAAVLAESKKSPLEDCSHLPAMRIEERHVLAWLESRIASTSSKDCGFIGAFVIEE